MFFTRSSFQNHWMTVDTWAELINTHCQMLEEACFNGMHRKWINASIESK